VKPPGEPGDLYLTLLEVPDLPPERRGAVLVDRAAPLQPSALSNTIHLVPTEFPNGTLTRAVYRPLSVFEGTSLSSDWRLIRRAVEGFSSGTVA
jgi:hypothetical protein